jgi:hypothetical protein
MVRWQRRMGQSEFYLVLAPKVLLGSLPMPSSTVYVPKQELGNEKKKPPCNSVLSPQHSFLKR